MLLAPAGASLDMFANYPARGEAFARAVHACSRRRRERRTTEEPRRPAPTAAEAPPSWARERLATLKELLDRPLTTYYLILGCSALLLALGLMMVLSASSIEATAGDRQPVLLVHQAVAVGGDRPAAHVDRRPRLPHSSSAGPATR